MCHLALLHSEQKNVTHIITTFSIAEKYDTQHNNNHHKSKSPNLSRKKCDSFKTLSERGKNVALGITTIIIKAKTQHSA